MTLRLPEGRRIVAVAAVAAVVAAATAYLWPAVMRSDDRVDTLLAGDGQLSASYFELGRRLRERGESVDDSLLVPADAVAGCDQASFIGKMRDELEPSVVVVSYQSADDDGCPSGGSPEDFLRAVVEAARPSEVLLVVQPGIGGQDDEMVAAIRSLDSLDGVTVVDPSRLLLTDDGGYEAPCQWWDDCAPDGFVAIREPSGELTAAGRERVARAVAAAIP